MPDQNDQIEVYCDEAGHTGADLLNLDQKYFAFASVNMNS